MNKAALLMIDVFGGTAMPEMNLTTAGPDYAAFNSTQQEYVRVTGEFNKMLRRTLDEGFTFNFNGERVSSGSSTLRKR